MFIFDSQTEHAVHLWVQLILAVMQNRLLKSIMSPWNSAVTDSQADPADQETLGKWADSVETSYLNEAQCLRQTILYPRPQPSHLFACSVKNQQVHFTAAPDADKEPIKVQQWVSLQSWRLFVFTGFAVRSL